MNIWIRSAVALSLSALSWAAQPITPGRSPVNEQIGRAIFFDENLSEPKGQACATCHQPSNGYNGNGDVTAAQVSGAITTRFGPRNPPSAAYAFGSPAPGYQIIDGEALFIGGQFWDGRAATLSEQAKAPFLNPVEMNNPSSEAVVRKVCTAKYAPLFVAAYGADICAGGRSSAAYQAIADAIAAFESSIEVNPFSSKYDRFLEGKGQLTPQERRGLELFEGKAGCAACHPSGPKSFFTDFSYDNIGIPKNVNSAHAKIDPNFIDLGLGALLGPTEDGKFKVSTLRNVAVSPPYGHNGFFKTLKEIVHFYNTRDVDPIWPAPEVVANVNRDELGNLGLTPAEEDDIVAFLGALTDAGRGQH